MASTIGWLDYSEEHRQKMREIIDLFKDTDTLDELGIGSVREAFSELLFPGLSTIQTRARYFLFVPWVYRRMEDEKVPSARAAEKARSLLTQLIESLERGGASGNEGIIGWDARRNLKRLPTEVYWAGLATYGIRLFTGSSADLHRSLDAYHERFRHFNKGEGDEISERFAPNWTSHLPRPPQDLWKETSLALTPDEAQFLADQIQLNCPDTFLSFCLDNPADLSDIGVPWAHPAVDDVEDPTATWLHHARLFAEVIQGAAFAYNLMLAERARDTGLSVGSTDLLTKYTSELETWVEKLSARWPVYEQWDRTGFWAVVLEGNSRVYTSTRNFVNTWIDLVQQDRFAIPDLPAQARSLISNRERQLKGGKARLHNRRALEMWSTAAGVGLLTYRWPTARSVVSDIHDGLNRA